MLRPNFQMIEDQPEKNYMRYVSQYKLDDMVIELIEFTDLNQKIYVIILKFD